LLSYISELIELHKVIAKSDGIVVELTIEDMPSLIIGDQFDLTLIISNLLSNAIKYGKKGGTVSIDIKKINEEQWVLKVTNPGKGIPPDKIGTIFTPFISNRSGAIQGTGLGLYIVKTKVEAMHGSITVVSDPDIFTQFIITLPLKEGRIKDLPNEERAKLQNDLDLKKIHCMVAEDHNMAVAYLKMLFAEIGCKGTFYPDGSELLKAAAREQPDIIMVDYNLPVLNGEETIRQLKKDALLKDIPIIVTSGDIDQKNIDRMMVAGADAYMEKTPDKDTFINTIKLYLKQDRRISIKKGSFN
jgi:CheY-like chemotaxis protein